ncbi:hypothetical protein ABLG96_01195 [Nakamurella sp. A5-74]|uniref:Uncharacterized protein n=1 Tax=Nakamurella sp. A5-74 TaxID=3158264 RepID=A0AAU8DNY7_9ACTN
MTQQTLAAAVALAESISRAVDDSDVPLRAVIDRVGSHPEREAIVEGVVRGLGFAGVRLLNPAGNSNGQDFTGFTTGSPTDELVLRRQWGPDGRYHMQGKGDGSDLPSGFVGLVALAIRDADALSREMDDDYEGLWAVVDRIRAALPDAPDQLVHNVVGGMLLGLADTGIIVYSDDFKPWPDQHRAFERVLENWKRAGTDPDMSDPWFARD